MHDPHYLRHIFALDAKHAVRTHRPIMSAHGIKLVDQGVHITDALYEKLVCHKLMPDVDECLSIDHAVSAASLAEDIGRLLDTATYGRWLAAAVGARRVVAVFADLPLDPVLAFKLTVARERFPRIYRHSLEVAACAVVLAALLPTGGLSPSQAAACGLFHDLGLLHVDPLLLDESRPLSEAERHHIYSHPVVAHLVLARYADWHPAVSRAVLEHHERLDGSGYPRALHETAISWPGQLLGVAELAATLFGREGSRALADDMHVVLRLNRGKLNPELTDLLVRLAQQAPLEREAAEFSYSGILADLVGLSASFQNWHAVAAHCGELPVVALIGERLQQLERNLAGIGIDLQYWSMVDVALTEDLSAMAELAVGAREGRWQLEAIVREVMRKWENLHPASTATQELVLGWLRDSGRRD